MEKLLASLRDNGWTVAVHNDYRLNGRAMTFWLMTHSCGLYLKAEGLTDMDALREIEAKHLHLCSKGKSQR